MSLARVHNFSVSLDSFGTGEGQGPAAPYGHAGQRLHDWMFATRWGRHEVLGQPGGSAGIFIDAPPAEALETARKAAGDQDVRLGGGPTMIRDFV